MDDAHRHHFSVLLEQFDDWLAGRHDAPRTRDTDRHHLRRWVDWLDDQTPVTRVSEITPAQVQAYQIALAVGSDREEGVRLSVGAQRLRLTVVRQWFAWLVRTRQMACHPASEVALPRRPVTLPLVLSPSQARRLVEACSLTASSPLEVRDRAVLEVLYSPFPHPNHPSPVTTSIAFLCSWWHTARHRFKPESPFVGTLGDTSWWRVGWRTAPPDRRWVREGEDGHELGRLHDDHRL
jgi:hypothetical protein